jgi:transposase
VTVEPVVRFETPPAHQGQIDFAHFHLPWGRRWALLVVLGYSRLLWLRFFPRQDMATLFSGLEQAFRYFDGVPHELLFDQMRSVVIDDQRLEGGSLVENLEFLRFAHHWQFRLRACRPYRAKTKDKVERPIRYVRENFFYGRHFLNDQDLDAQLHRWLEDVANVRVHGTTNERPIDRFQRDEQALLGPIPAAPYRSLVLAAATVQRTQSTNPWVSVQQRPLDLYRQVAEGRP